MAPSIFRCRKRLLQKLATTGGPGTRFYEEESDPGDQLVKEMQQAGFRTLQLQWFDGWLYSDPGQREGNKRLGCRPATVARWVYDNLHTEKASAGYCAGGIQVVQPR